MPITPRNPSCLRSVPAGAISLVFATHSLAFIPASHADSAEDAGRDIQSAQPADQGAQQESPPLRVGPLVAVRSDPADLGTRPPDELIVRTIQFVNSGDRTVSVAIASVSCRCVEAEVTPAIVPPGDTCTLRISAHDWTRSPGPIRHAATMRVTDAETLGPALGTLTIPIEWRIEQRLTLRGTSLRLHPLVGRNARAWLYAKSATNIVDAIDRLEVSSQVVNLGEPIEFDRNHWAIPVTLAPSWSDAPRRESIRIDPVEGGLPIVIPVHIRPVPMISADPPAVIRSGRSGVPIQADIAIRVSAAAPTDDIWPLTARLAGDATAFVRMSADLRSPSDILTLSLSLRPEDPDAIHDEVLLTDRQGNRVGSIPLILIRMPAWR